jgi:hypothetical protein
MQILSLGYCPFRVEVSNFKAGCVLQMGNESTCYTQDVKPLIQRAETDNYFCPLIKFELPIDIYNAISRLIEPLLTIQDHENTGINVWPMVKGISTMKNKATTPEGKEIERISQKVKDALEKIVLDLE